MYLLFKNFGFQNTPISEIVEIDSHSDMVLQF